MEKEVFLFRRQRLRELYAPPSRSSHIRPKKQLYSNALRFPILYYSCMSHMILRMYGYCYLSLEILCSIVPSLIGRCITTGLPYSRNICPETPETM